MVVLLQYMYRDLLSWYIEYIEISRIDNSGERLSLTLDDNERTKDGALLLDGGYIYKQLKSLKHKAFQFQFEEGVMRNAWYTLLCTCV